jgi:hypothetical protein
MGKAMKSLKSRLAKIEDEFGEEENLCPRCARMAKMSDEELIAECIKYGIPLGETIERWYKFNPEAQQKVTDLLKK